MVAGEKLFYLDPKYAPGAEQARQDATVAISILVTIFGMTFVGLRVYTRAFIVRNIGMEDWTMLAAAVFTVVFLIQLLVGYKKYMVGFSTMAVTPDQMVGSSKLGLASIAVYKLTVTLIKISILMIYLRLAVTRTFSWLCKCSIVLLVVYQFIVLIVVPAECKPLRKAWNPTVEGNCIDIPLFYYITSAFHIVMDVWILSLPYKLIFSILRPLRKRLAVYAVFGLGFFGTLCAIVRFNYLVVVNNSMDPYYDSIPLNTWSIIEINVGIVCASMPTLRPLFSKAQRNRTKQALNITDEKTSEKSKSRRGGLLQAKEMFISLTTGTFRDNRTSSASSLVEELDWFPDRPPQVPPKDASRIAIPETAHQKL